MTQRVPVDEYLGVWHQNPYAHQRVTLKQAQSLAFHAGSGTFITNGKVWNINQKRIMAGVYEVWLEPIRPGE